MKGYLQKRNRGEPIIQTARRCAACGKNPPFNSLATLCTGCRVKRDMRSFSYRRPRPPQGAR